MAIRLPSLEPWRSNAPRAYYVLTAGWGFFYSMAFTLTLVYQVEVAHLSPLELVLVGTVLEFTCFIGEIPTGVVADLYSRRLSVLIGFVAIGAGIVLQGALPHFWWILAAQVVWAIGFTFTSGATDASNSQRGRRLSGRARVHPRAADRARLHGAGHRGRRRPRHSEPPAADRRGAALATWSSPRCSPSS